MSKSRQSCSYCGWSKVTTYQGLRIHQGIKGCTPKGLRIPQSAQSQYSPLSYYSSSSSCYSSSYSQPAVSYTPPPIKKETYAAPTPKYTPQPSNKICYEPPAGTQEKLRSCHCGWSKVTSYRGLRIHQGRMGCTPKGLAIPENQQHLFSSSAQKYEVTPTIPWENLHSVNDSEGLFISFGETRDSQPFTKTRRDPEVEELWKTEYNPSNRSVQKKKHPIPRPKPVLKPVSQSTPATTEASLKKENKSCFETPREYRPSTGDGAKTRRALDFSSREKQVAVLPIKSKDYSFSTAFDSRTLQMKLSTMMQQMQQIQKELDQLSARDLKTAAGA